MHPQAQAIFEELIERPASERSSLAPQRCGGNAALLEDVLSLLNAHDRAEGFLHAPTGGSPAPTVQAALREIPGTKIGHYKLLQQIGEGGFGVVFLAEQEQPVRRRVALKIIKLGMDTRQVIARFEAERQALAMMDHPNIAKVLDAGATDSGRPYFVMELVKGDPITDYCDTNNLDTEERLDLFIQICHAVQHAHQKGIIHRDIKPSNVLVTIADGKPIPKVIDFGIAKATSARLTERTLFTEHRALIGTPEYMSPEQAEMSGVDIDTRSDIYSLGVLLYELLTGTTPFDSQELRSAAFGEIQRIIREVEPPKPSTRLSTLGDTLPGIAAHRRTEPARLSRMIRGDLDWIVMKALEKDRTRRYETANNLADDVRRHLSGETVNAAPPSTAYRMKKFVRRHRVGVAAGSAIAAALVLGIVGTTWGFLGQRSLRIAAEEARNAEQAQRERAEAVVAFVQSALQSSDPNQGGRQGMLVTDAMLKAVKLLDEGAFRDQPEVEAVLRVTIAQILNGNGRSSEALPLSKRALEIFRQLHPEDCRNVAATLSAVALVLDDLGQLDEAETTHAQSLQMYQRLFPGDHAAVAKGLNNLGAAKAALGKLAEAESLAVSFLEMTRRLYPGDHEDVAHALNNVAVVREKMGRAAEAEPLYVQALEMRQRLHTGDHPHVAASLNNVAFVRKQLGRLSEAEPLYVQALNMRKRLFAGDHPAVAESLNKLASLQQESGRDTEALPLFEEALEMRRRLYPGDHPDVSTSLNNLGIMLARAGRMEEAERVCSQSLEMDRRLYPGDHEKVSTGLNNVAHLRQALGDTVAAERMYQQSLEMCQRMYRGDHPDIVGRLTNLADLRSDAGKKSEAESLYRQALEMSQRLFQGDHPLVAMCLSNLGEELRELDRAAEAAPLARDALAMKQRLYPGDHSGIAISLDNLSKTYSALGRTAEAEALMQQSLEMLQRVYPGDHRDLARGLSHRAFLLVRQGRPAEAEPLLVQALAMWRRLGVEDGEEVPECARRLANVLKQLGRPSEAEAAVRMALAMYQRQFAGDHALIAACLSEVGIALVDQDRNADAEPIFRQSLEMYQRVRQSDHSDVVSALRNLALACEDLDRQAEAEPLFRQALEMSQRLHGTDHPDVLEHIKDLARCLASLGRHDEANRYRREALNMTRKLEPADSSALASALAIFGRGVLGHSPTPQAAAEAEPLLRECLSIRRHEFPAGHEQAWRTFNAMSLLGEALVVEASDSNSSRKARIEKLREAEPLILDGYVGLKDAPNVPASTATTDHRRDALQRIVRLYETWEGVEPGKGYQEKATEWLLRAGAPP